jgi:DNA replication protein DnaC
MLRLGRCDFPWSHDLKIGWSLWGEHRHLLEVLEDRYGRSSTVVTSQLPIAKWHEWLGDPTAADAILDRLIHNAYKVELKGQSRRKEITK